MFRSPTTGLAGVVPDPGVLRRQREVSTGALLPPQEIAGLLAWFDPLYGVFSDAGITPAAATDPLQEWHDRQGSYIASATGTARPTMTAAAIGSIMCPNFDGTNDILALNSSIPMPAGQGYTGFSVYNRASAAHKLGGLQTSSALLAPYPSLLWTDGFSYHTGSGAAGLNTRIACGITGKLIVSTSFNGVSHEVYYNGVDQVENILGSFSYGTTLDQIGARGTPAGDFARGAIGDLLFYSRELTALERQTVENYLITKYLTAQFSDAFSDAFRN